MSIHRIIRFLPLFWFLPCSAQTCGLQSSIMDKYWLLEAESPSTEIRFVGKDTCEILSPKGMTLWRKEKMKGDITIEFDACVMDEGKEGDRLSDLNCFWMASDPKSKDVFARSGWRNGSFVKYYSLNTYYLGYGGNYNSTTRFRKYTGDEEGIDNVSRRPAILKEYNDKEHLLRPNHWYHVKLRNYGNRIQYFIDGEQILNYYDPSPLREGWFGFRTTLSRTRFANFKYYKTIPQEIPVHWVGEQPHYNASISFGVPFAKGELRNVSNLSLGNLPTDSWINAKWDDGSIKWAGLSVVVPETFKDFTVRNTQTKQSINQRILVDNAPKQYKINTGKMTVYVAKSGNHLIDSIISEGVKVVGLCKLKLSTQDAIGANETIHFTDYENSVNNVSIERQGNVRAVIKINGCMKDVEREWLPFVVRLYLYADSEEIGMTFSFIYDGEQDKDFIHSLGMSWTVPMRETAYNRHVAFTTANGGVWSEPIQPLDGRESLGARHDSLQILQMKGYRVPEYNKFNDHDKLLIDNWASWDNFRLSQLDDQSFTIRKRSNQHSPWIGTYTGHQSNGFVFAGDVSGGLCVSMEDFWQSYPSSITIQDARGDEAELTMWMWSPEAEPMDLRHYDDKNHGLMASYEDVQEGLSTPYGIGRTFRFHVLPVKGYPGKEAILHISHRLTQRPQLLCTPEYLHDKQAFGVWSLPDSTTNNGKMVERRLDDYIMFFQNAIKQHHWYGFWNYGDVMHAYDDERHEWRYDVGGYAWDNTELATPMWLWYMFLRTGKRDILTMATAMTQHNSDVDTYHLGPMAGLGSRHNVSHWGCGAKEARISQAAFSRFYYYLTTDEHTGDVLTEMKDADQLLYNIDPMRLAEPREKYPTSAPARLRLGPDWLAYAGNWMTQWERTGDTYYRNKLVSGMKSISSLPHGFYTSQLAVGYDPSTGSIIDEGDTTRMVTTHLFSIMGGFEVINELTQMLSIPEFEQTWLDYASTIGKSFNGLPRLRYVKRLMAYAANRRGDHQMAEQLWQGLWGEVLPQTNNAEHVRKIVPPQVPEPSEEWPGISTNQAALWSLDAIYMQEVLPPASFPLNR